MKKGRDNMKIVKMKEKKTNWSGNYYGLTYGKEYEVIDDGDKVSGFYKIKLDNGKIEHIDSSYFEEI
jgi:hypothetical protein